jgi:hypothetical protein
MRELHYAFIFFLILFYFASAKESLGICHIITNEIHKMALGLEKERKKKYKTLESERVSERSCRKKPNGRQAKC